MIAISMVCSNAWKGGEEKQGMLLEEHGCFDTNTIYDTVDPPFFSVFYLPRQSNYE
jgi:hypothetical protein